MTSKNRKTLSVFACISWVAIVFASVADGITIIHLIQIGLLKNSSYVSVYLNGIFVVLAIVLLVQLIIEMRNDRKDDSINEAKVVIQRYGRLGSFVSFRLGIGSFIGHILYLSYSAQLINVLVALLIMVFSLVFFIQSYTNRKIKKGYEILKLVTFSVTMLLNIYSLLISEQYLMISSSILLFIIVTLIVVESKNKAIFSIAPVVQLPVTLPPIETGICPNCHVKVDEGMFFCDNCGSKLR